MTIFTIGYEGINVEAFIELLNANHIETLVDVRQLPLSRKPGFSKRVLADALSSVGIEYIHLANLGCPKPVRDRYREDGDWKRYTRDFVRHIASQQATVKDLAERCLTSNCALMCFEADYNRCHRSMVADAVSQQNTAGVVHIAVKDVRSQVPANRRRPIA